MNVRTAARWTAASVAGGLMLFVGLSVLAPSMAGAVPPPSSASVLVAQVEEESPEPVAPTAQVEEGETPIAMDLTRQEFARELDGAGISFSQGGNAIVSEEVGLGSPRQLVLAQMAADRFGIVQNPYFDPSRVAVVRDGEAIADLGTGVILGHRYGSAMFGRTEVIAMDLLDELRVRAGWSITEARKDTAARYAKLLGGYVPVAFQSDEAYASYVEAARANYLSLAG